MPAQGTIHASRPGDGVDVVRVDDAAPDRLRGRNTPSRRIVVGDAKKQDDPVRQDDRAEPLEPWDRLLLGAREIEMEIPHVVPQRPNLTSEHANVETTALYQTRPPPARGTGRWALMARVTFPQIPPRCHHKKKKFGGGGR